MNKTVLFKNSVKEVLDNFTTNEIKELIGDSVNNHRVLTVNQVSRFLRTKKRTRVLAKQLNAVYSKVRVSVLATRFLNGSRRTDAIDINEFFMTFEELTFSKNTSRSLGQILHNAV